MRKFFDLHLKPPDDTGVLETMLELASRLGFKGVGVVSIGIPQKTVKEMASGHGLDHVRRTNLTPRNPQELMVTLRRLRRQFEIIAVECRSKAVARQAAKDNRVDILNFPTSASARKRVWFDRQEASLASGANCAYEVNVSDLLQLGQLGASRLLSVMRDEVDNAVRFGVPVVVSSGADNPLTMRVPRELAAVLELLGIGEEEGLDAVSTTPWGIVDRNREKLGPGFVAPGVRVV